MNLTTMKKISLKNHAAIKEENIQQFIFEDPSVLGLPGEISAIQREKLQPSGGRLDMLFGDDSGTRYEVEIQLGATDPSHIIRTLEYWDTERKRYPQYDHCAVIVAEEITGRFMNVISLFNGAIPLIALQMSAYETGDDISLVFTKVIDRIEFATDEEEEYEITDRNYWETVKSTPKVLKITDQILDDLGEVVSGYEMKYNKFYIGLAKDGSAKNYVIFKPKKKYTYVNVSDLAFFLVEVHVYTIGESLPAPYFKIIEQPNDFSKTAKNISKSEKLSAAKESRLDFWNRFNDVLEANGKPFNKRKATTDHWYEVAVGTSKAHITIDLVNKEHRIRVGLWISDDKDMFDELYEKKEEIEREFGSELVWYRLDDKKASIICTYIDGLDFKKQDNYPELMQKIIDTVVKLRSVLKKHI